MQSSNFLKKFEKKLRKHQHVISKSSGVICTNESTQFLAICNIGQVNGLTEDTIIENFQSFGDLKQVLLIPGESYCFLSYAEKTSAMKAMQTLNGKLQLAQDDKPIYLSYIENLPTIQNNNNSWNKLPPGLIILEDFITEDEEITLINLHKFDEDFNDNNLKHRQVKHFGYEFRYDINNVDKDKPLQDGIPVQCDFLWPRLNEKRILPNDFIPNQLTINHYKSGQGIPPHIDTHSAFEDPIISLSLGSPVVMDFKNNNENISVFLPRRSLAIMSGDSRYEWSHGITPKKFDFVPTDNGCKSFRRDTRISFTFRKVLRGECCCKYQSFCDSYKKREKPVKIDEAAAVLENLHVYNVYEDIANHFSDTRHKPWPNVLNFVQNIPQGGILVDVGCGNGKYFGHFPGIIEIGVDRSFKLNEVCKARGFESCAANCLNLPFKDCIADAVLSIAVIHHLASEERRLHAVKEIVRVLRVGGSALIYVWAKNQLENNEKSTYIKQDRKNWKKDQPATQMNNKEIKVTDSVVLPVHNNRTNFNYNDMLVPWKLKSGNNVKEPETFLRFYHVFESGEIEELCRKLENIEIVRSYYDQGNHCIIFKRVK